MKIFSLSFVFLFLSFSLLSQANLVVSVADFSPTTVKKGDAIVLTFTVSNIGNATAGSSYAYLYIAEDPQDDNTWALFGQISVPSLSPNQSTEITYILPISKNLPSGSYYPVVEVGGGNAYCFGTSNCASFFVQNSQVYNHKIPYPVLFIHGWTGHGPTWDDLREKLEDYYGFSYGYEKSVCLNYDENRYFGRASTDIQGFTSTTIPKVVADLYYLNFDISAQGELHVAHNWEPWDDDDSNQSAIVKQGKALKIAISEILQLTGKDKVILVGHSMGGLCAREYLQNSSNWINGEHHVAKLLTIGTPNGGSNTTTWAGLVGTLSGYNTDSEAVRDLRYKDGIIKGVYLDGGNEGDFGILNNYDNHDVNCDGDDNDQIVGLNQKTSPSDVAYSCVIGDLLGGGGDGVVATLRANLENYLIPTPPFQFLHADKFTVNKGHLSIHKELTSEIASSLDEPNTYEHAYELPLNEVFWANFSKPATNAGLSGQDKDYFKFTVPQTGNVTVVWYGIPTKVGEVILFNSNLSVLQSVQTNGRGSLSFTKNLAAGTYYIEYKGLTDDYTWQFPYCYGVLYEPTTSAPYANFSSSDVTGCGPFTVQYSNSSLGNPTSYNWTFEGGSPSTSTQSNPSVTYNNPGIFDVTLVASNAGGSNTARKENHIQVYSKPTPNFTHSVNGAVVNFNNQTLNTNPGTTYNWTFDDNTFTFIENPIHTYAQPGTYNVKLKATNVCGNNNITKTINTSVSSVNESGENINCTIVPNPNNGSFKLDLKGINGNFVKLSLFNTLGSQVWTEKKLVHSFNLSTDVQLEILPKGAYVLVVETVGGLIRKMMVIQ